MEDNNSESDAVFGGSERTSRALLSTLDRELVSTPSSELDNPDRKYQSHARISNRATEQLPKDLAILRTNHPRIYAEAVDSFVRELDVRILRQYDERAYAELVEKVNNAE